MSRILLAVAIPLLPACLTQPAPSVGDADPSRSAVELVVCEQPVDAASIEEVEAAAAEADAVEADGDFACASCECDCDQAACSTAGCVATPTGQGDCKQNGSTCNGTTCTCDCYTVLGKACPAPGSSSRSPERITLTNGVGGVVKACDFR